MNKKINFLFINFYQYNSDKELNKLNSNIYIILKSHYELLDQLLYNYIILVIINIIICILSNNQIVWLLLLNYN